MCADERITKNSREYKTASKTDIVSFEAVLYW